MPASDPHARNLRKHRCSVAGAFYAITTCCYQRRPVFSHREAGGIVVEEIARLDQSAYTDTFAFVVMPDHVHWLFCLLPHHELSEVVRLVKGRTAARINTLMSCAGRMWQAGYHERQLRSDESLERIGEYIVHNPVRAGLVERVEAYALWDVGWDRFGHLLRRR